MYYYFIYGLGIQSEIPLYQLEQCEGEKVDVKIHRGELPEDIIEYMEKGTKSSMSPNRVWFYNDIGHFIVLNGNEMVIKPLEGATYAQLASFVLGWGIAFLFQQRGCSAIHCSALEMNSQAVFISGRSGSGKSTIAMSLIKKGYRYLADDIAMVDIQNDLTIQPAFPQQKVCRDVAEAMDSDKLYYVDEKKDKFAYQNAEDFCFQPRRLSTMFLLSQYDGDELEIEKLKGLAKWNGVIDNLFLLDAYKAFQYMADERERCLAIAGKVEVYAIRRPKGKDTVEEICSRIIELMQKQGKEDVKDVGNLGSNQ